MQVDFLLDSKSVGTHEVAVRMYDCTQLLQRFVGHGIGGLGRPVLLVEMQEFETDDDLGVVQVEFEGRVPANICAIGEQKHMQLTPRLMVWDPSQSNWTDVTKKARHHVRALKVTES